MSTWQMKMCSFFLQHISLALFIHMCVLWGRGGGEWQKKVIWGVCVKMVLKTSCDRENVNAEQLFFCSQNSDLILEYEKEKLLDNLSKNTLTAQSVFEQHLFS